MKVLITGTAGFIGFWLTRRLVQAGIPVVGVDNLNAYYDPDYKKRRLSILGITGPEVDEGGKVISNLYPALSFRRIDIAHHEAVLQLFSDERPTHVVHLAAQAGVRWSINHPYDYLHSNLDGFLSMLEAVRRHPVCHFIYASSSSVYGSNDKIPFSEKDSVNNPKSLYAATKRSNELLAHVYSGLYDICATGLRFFTVYGPWGRPDMAPMIFARAIMEHKPITLFNHGDMKRDFTYIEDIVTGIEKVLNGPYQPGTHKIYNIGHGSPVHLTQFITIMEEMLEHKVEKLLLPMQPGDVPVTYADTTSFEQDYGYHAATTLPDGLKSFAEWIKSYYTSKTE